MNPSEAWEFSLLALCIWREARGESLTGKIAVGWSIRNRVEKPSWWGTSYPEVILKPWQYSSFNHGDPNATLYPGTKDFAWIDCLDAAEAAYTAHTPDPTGGATHYYATSMAPPTWASTGKMTVEIGNHRFFTDVK